jgi:sugar phosphate isomerase/epimerase
VVIKFSNPKPLSMMAAINNRRAFLKSMGMLSLSPLLMECTRSSSEESSSTTESTAQASLFFKISLAEWSLHRALQSGQLTNLDFPAKAKNDFGIDAVEYVNQFFMDKAQDKTYLGELKKRCDDLGVTSVLIMCDNEGYMADADAAKRLQAVQNHYKWVDAAQFLGCHAIRVNCFGEGTAEDVAKAGADGLRRLSEYAQQAGIHVIVENHGGYSSNGQWLAGVMKAVGMANCGTLPDFGNFCIRREKGDMWESPCVEWYDRYQGVEEIMPFAKGVSAKTYQFDAEGNCIESDYARMLPIVKQAGYTGYIGIEYEGSDLSEEQGIRATKALLERVGAAVA